MADEVVAPAAPPNTLPEGAPDPQPWVLRAPVLSHAAVGWLILASLIMVGVGKAVARGDKWPQVVAEMGAVLVAFFTPPPKALTA